MVLGQMRVIGYMLMIILMQSYLYENDLLLMIDLTLGGHGSNIDLVKIILGILDKDHGYTNSEILIEHVEDKKVRF